MTAVEDLDRNPPPEDLVPAEVDPPVGPLPEHPFEPISADDAARRQRPGGRGGVCGRMPWRGPVEVERVDSHSRPKVRRVMSSNGSLPPAWRQPASRIASPTGPAPEGAAASVCFSPSMPN